MNIIQKCRVCGNPHLVRVLDLGHQMLTGVFPRNIDAVVTSGPLRLVKCVGGEDVCGLLQLDTSFDLREMYGENYGYRSGLNPSMVSHLHGKVDRIQTLLSLKPGDLVIDIGSNDSTTLQAYDKRLKLVGVDPTGVKFNVFYPEHIKLIPDFFSSKVIKERFAGRKARVVTSFSMFYDLESPMDFMREVYEILEDDGIWVFEQSYMPTMMENNAYDTICHEHLEFYALEQIKWMSDRVGFVILDVEFNDVNGGSFSVTVSKRCVDAQESPAVRAILDRERKLELNTLQPYQEFAQRIADSRRALLEFIVKAKGEGKTVAALGASTKGNVLLQYCGLSDADIKFIGEINSEKFGCYTPGSWIPIISEDELLEKKPDFLIVLPWHLRNFFLERKNLAGANLVFPLPDLQVMVIPPEISGG